MVSFQDRDLKRFENILKGLASRSFPYATKFTLNKAGFEARSDWQNQIDETFVNRNKWTKRSIRVEQTRSLDVRAQRVVVGSVADYMADQEFGTTLRKQGKRGIPIATSYSAGQGMSSKPRTRLPRGANKLARITLRDRRKVTGSRKRQNAAAIRMAAQSSNKFVYLDLGQRQGLFKITGGKRKPRVKMVHDLSNPSVTLQPRPTLQPALAKTEKKLPQFYYESLRFQLKRQGLA